MRAKPRSLLSLLITSLTLLACAKQNREAYVLLPNVEGIDEKAPVTYLGVEIGRVARIAIEDRQVRLTLRFTRPDLQVRTQDSVRVVGDVFGSTHVEIVPGSGNAALLENGGTLIAAANSGPWRVPGDSLLAALANCGIKLPGISRDSVPR